MMLSSRHAVWLLVAVLAVCPFAASAGDSASLGDRAEATLDIDGDGKLDRVVLRRHSDGAKADIAIYLGSGGDKFEPSLTPSFFRGDLTVEGILIAFESKGRGSLLITYGCGGCSNDYSTTLTIVHRRGEFLVGGVTYDWDTRNGIGSCDINFLTGKGVLTSGLAPDQTIKTLQGRFAPIKLAKWSGERLAECDL
jgi:hypothetical protein